MTFWRTLKASYTGGFSFALACPLLFAVPVALELVQHVMEVHQGMYDSIAAAKAADADPVRLGFGLLKVAALTLSAYWIARFLAWREPTRVSSCDATAFRLFAGVLAFQVGLSAMELFALPRTGALLLAETVGGIVLNVVLAAWFVAAPLGNPRIGPWRSIRLMAPRLPWSAGLPLAATLPLVVPHYVLAALALIGPRQLLWAALIADSALVGLLGAVMAASGFLIAARAAGLAGMNLTGGGDRHSATNGRRPIGEVQFPEGSGSFGGKPSD